jgi:hypothetical protein
MPKNENDNIYIIPRSSNMEWMRKAFHLAARGHLPGVFKMGRQWALDKEIGREGIRSRAGGH